MVFSGPLSKNPYFTEGGVRKMNIVRVFTIFKFCIPPTKNIGLFECPFRNTNKNKSPLYSEIETQ